MAQQPTVNPELTALLEQVEHLKTLYKTAAVNRASTGRRNKYESAILELANSNMPILVLDNNKFNNKSEASMNSQFKKVSEDKNLPTYFCTFVGEEKVLVNFDHENVEEAFEQYVLERAKITSEQLAQITADLDAATR